MNGPDLIHNGKVYELKTYKDNKIIKEELARDRTPLYVSHLTGKITGSPNQESGPDFANRLQRIRSSLDKINNLMVALKELSCERSDDAR